MMVFFVVICSPIECLIVRNCPVTTNRLNTLNALNKPAFALQFSRNQVQVRCRQTCRSSTIMATTDEKTESDPFLKVISKMPKETYDLLISNVDPSTVNAADLVSWLASVLHVHHIDSS
jgi:hypothetical protein